MRNGFIFKKKDYCKNLINILVLGGSGGSHFINFCIPYAMKLLKKKKISISLEHQTGLKDYNKIVKIYKKFGLNVKIKTFISDILFSYRKADLLIARSGATTCAETSALGLPAIFIPFPESVYNHQIFNAMILAQSGGAILLPQSDLTPNNLFNIITDLIFNIRTLQVMSNKIFSFSKYDATKRISKILLSHL